jgi:hypothetical protein
LPALSVGAYYTRVSARQDELSIAEAWQIFGVRGDTPDSALQAENAPASFKDLFEGKNGVSMQMEVIPLDSIQGRDIEPMIERNLIAQSTPIVCVYWGDVEPLP